MTQTENMYVTALESKILELADMLSDIGIDPTAYNDEELEDAIEAAFGLVHGESSDVVD